MRPKVLRLNILIIVLSQVVRERTPVCGCSSDDTVVVFLWGRASQVSKVHIHVCKCFVFYFPALNIFQSISFQVLHFLAPRFGPSRSRSIICQVRYCYFVDRYYLVVPIQHPSLNSQAKSIQLLNLTRHGSHASSIIADEDEGRNDSNAQKHDDSREYYQRQPRQFSQLADVQRRCNDKTYMHLTRVAS